MLYIVHGIQLSESEIIDFLSDRILTDFRDYLKSNIEYDESMDLIAEIRNKNPLICDFFEQWIFTLSESYILKFNSMWFMGIVLDNFPTTVDISFSIKEIKNRSVNDGEKSPIIKFTFFIHDNMNKYVNSMDIFVVNSN